MFRFPRTALREYSDLKKNLVPTRPLTIVKVKTLELWIDCQRWGRRWRAERAFIGRSKHPLFTWSKIHLEIINGDLFVKALQSPGFGVSRRLRVCFNQAFHYVVWLTFQCLAYYTLRNDEPIDLRLLNEFPPLFFVSLIWLLISFSHLCLMPAIFSLFFFIRVQTKFCSS